MRKQSFLIVVMWTLIIGVFFLGCRGEENADDSWYNVYLPLIINWELTNEEDDRLPVASEYQILAAKAAKE